MDHFLTSMIDQAKSGIKTIVLPEGNDIRTLEAAKKAEELGIANLIILGDEKEILQQGFQFSTVKIINPATDTKRDQLASMLYEIRKNKGMTLEDAQNVLNDVLYYGVMLVKAGYADGMVSGACHSTADVLRPSLQILKTAPGVKFVSSFFVIVVPDCPYGDQGTFIFSDCGLEVSPDAEKLAHIAINSARSFTQLIKSEPRVAMLSHSSYGSAKNDEANKVIQATQIAKELAPELMLDGELQLDAAIVEEVGKSKAPQSPVAGKANVLIFPDLDAGNIGYKLVQRLARAEAYGPITQGIAAPVNDLSRGCSADDIVGVIAITAVQAQQNAK